jgi:hypothetical protein
LRRGQREALRLNRQAAESARSTKFGVLRRLGGSKLSTQTARALPEKERDVFERI